MLELEAPIPVVLTYFGGLPEHLEIAAPLLEALRLPATFFLNPPAVLRDLPGWREALGALHQIGNGSHHGVTNEGSLPNWSLRTIEQDLHMTQEFFRDLFSVEPRVFGCDGVNLECADGTYLPLLEREFATVLRQEVGFRPTDHTWPPTAPVGSPWVLRFYELDHPSIVRVHAQVLHELASQPERYELRVLGYQPHAR